MSISSLQFAWKNFISWIRFLVLPEPDSLDHSFSVKQIGELHSVTLNPDAHAIDDQTWKDLLVQQYATVLSKEVSIFGQQILYQRLRTGLGDEQCAKLSERLQTLTQNPSVLDELHDVFQNLRKADAEIAGLLFRDSNQISLPGWHRYTWLIAATFFVSLGATLLHPFAGITASLSLLGLFAIQIHYHSAMHLWNHSMRSLNQLLGVCSVLGKRTEIDLKEFADNRVRAGRINRKLTRLPSIDAIIPGTRAYIDWLMIANVRHYFKSVLHVYANIDFLRDCYLRTSNLEADIALARHLLDQNNTCWAERHQYKQLAFTEAVHPLLHQARPLSIGLESKGAFISGKNGIGKSTLLRTIGINLIVARAFGFCYAKTANVSTRPVYASMQNEDSLLGGESLYIAELRRAKELLTAANGTHQGIYIIDEIFRGTNHSESVSAAAAVLKTLAQKGLVIVSSHNLVLAPLLEKWLNSLYVTATDDNAQNLILRPGILAHTNGIALLSSHGFGEQIEDNAGKVFNWLNSYLARPTDDCSHVLEM
ncbi:nucleoside-triphosphatase THEP1 [Undibacterium sp. GrIS 1.8]|uniref:MutS-related protein n=1 Tax=Undibacterium sp. GrIS 1.8 TaxID=3143934 RepID=UPI003390E8C1